MRRRKRFTIKLIALGLVVAGFAALPAQAKLDEGLNGLQPLGIETETLVTGSVGRPSPGPSFRLVGVESSKQQIVPSRLSHVKRDDDGVGIGTFSASGIVLLLALGAMTVAIYRVRSHRLASV